ncbi:GtrA family protein [Pseudomonas asplenii]|uniref:GtrA family protein n=1 Tax=Pseudomonas asplenii TaxID=53407 RepID=UPI0009B79A9D
MRKNIPPSHSPSLVQILRYVAVGGLVNGGGYLLFLILLFIGIEHKRAASLTYLLGVIASFGLNRKVVFASTLPLKSGLSRLCLTLIAGYLLNILTLRLGVDVLGYSASLIQLISIFCVSAFFYFANKFYVHRKNKA